MAVLILLAVALLAGVTAGAWLADDYYRRRERRIRRETRQAVPPSTPRCCPKPRIVAVIGREAVTVDAVTSIFSQN